MLAGKVYRLPIARIGMAHDAHARIVGQDPLQAASGFGGTIGDDDLSRMQTVANAHTAPMMEADPRSSPHGIHG